MLCEEIAHLFINEEVIVELGQSNVVFVLIIFNQVVMLQLLCCVILSLQVLICQLSLFLVANLDCFEGVLCALVRWKILLCPMVDQIDFGVDVWIFSK